MLSILLLAGFSLLILALHPPGFDPDLYKPVFIERATAVFIAISVMSFFYAYVRTRAQLYLDNQNRNYQDLANTDELTRMANRRRMTELLYQEVGRVRRNQGTFSLIVFDIDHFKTINDRFGHDAGDAVLASIPDITGRVLRTQDICSRWGGEEFLILLPETPLDGATLVAERLRNAFEKQEFLRGQDLLSVTISLGVYEFRDAKSLEDCLKQADKNLYTAKQQGRNLIIAGPRTEAPTVA